MRLKWIKDYGSSLLNLNCFILLRFDCCYYHSLQGRWQGPVQQGLMKSIPVLFFLVFILMLMLCVSQ